MARSEAMAGWRAGEAQSVPSEDDLAAMEWRAQDPRGLHVSARRDLVTLVSTVRYLVRQLAETKTELLYVRRIVQQITGLNMPANIRQALREAVMTPHEREQWVAERRRRREEQAPINAMDAHMRAESPVLKFFERHQPPETLGAQPADPSLAAKVGELEKAADFHIRATDIVLHQLAEQNRKIEDLANDRAAADAEAAKLRQQKDAAYAERNKLVAALSKVLPSHLALHPESDTTWDKDWRTIVVINGAAGQMTWHIHDSERPLFAHLCVFPFTWDGHTTEEKYRRLAQLASCECAGLAASLSKAERMNEVLLNEVGRLRDQAARKGTQ